MNQQGRFEGIDFWRGCVLCMILVDHMPGNALENLTPRNFGFSDAAEAFVFLSGVSIALAYGGRFYVGDRRQTLLGLARRALKLYGAHIALSLAALAIFYVGANWEGKPDLLAVHGREIFTRKPGLGMIGLVSLGHQLGYFNILPLYIVLLISAPAMLWLATIDRWLMLSCSALVYALFRLFNLNLPNWPVHGAWFFDPFAWQLLFAIGLAVGLHLRREPTPLSRPLLAIAAVIVFAGAFVVTDCFGLSHPLGEAIRLKLDLGKTQLGLVRLIHFLALAYLVYGLRITDRLRAFPLYRAAALLGRHSLWVFVLLSLFSAVWQVLVEAVTPTIVLDFLFFGASLIILYFAAYLSEQAQARPGQPDQALGKA